MEQPPASSPNPAPVTPLGAKTPHAHPALPWVIGGLSLAIAVGVAWALLEYDLIPDLGGSDPISSPVPSASEAPLVWHSERGFGLTEFPSGYRDITAELPADSIGTVLWAGSGPGGDINIGITFTPFVPDRIDGWYGALRPIRVPVGNTFGYVTSAGDAGCGSRAVLLPFGRGETLFISFNACEGDFAQEVAPAYRDDELMSRVLASIRIDPPVINDLAVAPRPFAYRSDNRLILHNPATGKDILVVESEGLQDDWSTSPDGSQVLYTLAEDYLTDENTDIYLFSAVSGNTTRLTERNDIASFSPRFSFDGSRACYYRNPIAPNAPSADWSIPLSGDADASRPATKGECPTYDSFPDGLARESLSCVSRLEGGIGGTSFPVRPEFSHLGALGAYLSAEECSSERVTEVVRDSYPRPDRIYLIAAPSSGLEAVLREAGMSPSPDFCAQTPDACTVWEAVGAEDLKPDVLLKLRPFFYDLRAVECVHCG